MDALRASGKDRHILYIESAYVREDCRRNGIFRMMTTMSQKVYSEFNECYNIKI